jgi:hypothetical protein
VSRIIEPTATLETRIAELELHEAARRLIAEYCLALDERDRDHMAALFDADAVFNSNGSVHNGRNTIASRLTNSNTSPLGRHLTVNWIIGRDGHGSLIMNCYFVFLVLDPDSDGTSRVNRSGRYRTRFTEVDGRLFIAEQFVTSDTPAKS